MVALKEIVLETQIHETDSQTNYRSNVALGRPISGYQNLSNHDI